MMHFCINNVCKINNDNNTQNTVIQYVSIKVIEIDSKKIYNAAKDLDFK